jgi:hypothetical protein
MSAPVTPEAAAAFLQAQGLSPTQEGSQANARFATLQLGNAGKAFAKLAFEEEPSGYTAALRASTR